MRNRYFRGGALSTKAGFLSPATSGEGLNDTMETVIEFLEGSVATLSPKRVWKMSAVVLHEVKEDHFKKSNSPLHISIIK